MEMTIGLNVSSIQLMWDLIVEDNAEGHFIGISIPLPDVKYYDKLRSALEYELRTMASQHTVKIDSRIEGKVKVLIENDERSRIEDLEESIRELRKSLLL